MHFFYFFVLLPGTRFLLFFEPHPLATVISIFCIPSLFSSFLLLFAPFRLAASVFAVPLNSHSHADTSHSSIVSHLLSILRPIISHTLSTLVSYRFSASYCPLIASHLPLSPHSSKHFYFLSHLFRQFLLSLIASLPYNSLHTLSLLSPSRFPPPLLHALRSQTRGINFTLPTHGIFRQSLSSIPTAVSSLFTFLCLSPISTRFSPFRCLALHRLQPHARMFFCMFLEVFYDLS